MRCPRRWFPSRTQSKVRVNQTLDQLAAAAAGDVAILAEIVQPVRHHLAARRMLPLSQITRVLSFTAASLSSIAADQPSRCPSSASAT